VQNGESGGRSGKRSAKDRGKIRLGQTDEKTELQTSKGVAPKGTMSRETPSRRELNYR